jgi:hypothetical protein
MCFLLVTNKCLAMPWPGSSIMSLSHCHLPVVCWPWERFASVFFFFVNLAFSQVRKGAAGQHVNTCGGPATCGCYDQVRHMQM